MTVTRLEKARKAAEESFAELEACRRIWSECVTNLHIAEVKLKLAQKHNRDCYFVMNEILEKTNEQLVT